MTVPGIGTGETGSVALLLAALAVLTYASRAAALVLLPDLPATLRRPLERIPAPLFASLAVLALVRPDGSAAPLPMLVAAGAAALTLPFRSLLLVLLGGLAGYLLAATILR